MRKPKNKPLVGKVKTPTNSPGRAGPSVQQLDRLLVPRVELYGQSNSLSNVDEVAAALRQKYNEYQRRQTGPFRQMVARAVQTVLSTRAQGTADNQVSMRINGGTMASAARSTSKPYKCMLLWRRLSCREVTKSRILIPSTAAMGK
jgi:hypothetical protein